jgi:hypothetical protein
LLSDQSWAVSSYRPDVAALTTAATRVVIAVGQESAGLFTDRSSRAVAQLLGEQPVVFPSHHGGFNGPDSGYPGQPEASPTDCRKSSTVPGESHRTALLAL